MGDAEREKLNAFRRQASICSEQGSPLYGALLERAGADFAEGGPVARVCADFSGHPTLDNLPLRLLGVVHAEVLAGRAPELARYYPSAEGRFEAAAAGEALLRFVERERRALAQRLADPLQTNEVRRCCALLGGFLFAARRAELPLRILELGASAGLNLAFDRFRYALGPHRFGPEGASVQLETEWRGPPPDLEAPLRVRERAGCDIAPIDVREPEQRLRLQGFVWPDQVDRLELLRAAIEVALAHPPRLARRPAGEWVPEQLAARRNDLATVLFQSVVWWYVPRDEQARITEAVHEAGRRAERRSPLFWLRMEGTSTDCCELRVLCFPDGEDRLLAEVHWHGSWVHWR